jgi:hypothetical protein
VRVRLGVGDGRAHGAPAAPAPPPHASTTAPHLGWALGRAEAELWLYCAAQHLPEGVFGNNWLELHHEASGGAPRVLCVRLNQRAYPRLAWARTARV